MRERERPPKRLRKRERGCAMRKDYCSMKEAKEEMRQEASEAQ